MSQLLLPLSVTTCRMRETRQVLEGLLASDLGFHGHSSSHASHNMHAFPAKFPPQLPRLFVDNLTQPGDTVLDPMMGSGTTMAEAVLAERGAVGLDIDPLALRISRVKTTTLDAQVASQVGSQLAREAEQELRLGHLQIECDIDRRFDPATRRFLNYWFSTQTQLELMALVRGIERVTDEPMRGFLELAFSAIIITKSGGVSLARDLAHTRPHRCADKANRPAFP